ncbi:MAG: hypothetical protein KF726_10585 [Anaerolineae bacterium]|nr:hypothetical protein [Anaerolineae bacterium]
MNKRIAVVLVLALTAATVFMFAGLPNMGFTTTTAAYAEGGCSDGVTYQLRAYDNIQLYSDSALSSLVVTLQSGVATKVLVCNESFPDLLASGVLKVTIFGNAYYVRSGAGSLAPRFYTDNQ